MMWIPIFEIASKDFEEDLRILRRIFDGFERQVGHKGGYRFSSEAQFAMGWWFYAVHVKIGFIRDLVAHRHSANPKEVDERAVLGLVREQLRSHKSAARAKFHGEKPPLAGYWSWLLR